MSIKETESSTSSALALSAASRLLLLRPRVSIYSLLRMRYSISAKPAISTSGSTIGTTAATASSLLLLAIRAVRVLTARLITSSLSCLKPGCLSYYTSYRPISINRLSGNFCYTLRPCSTSRPTRQGLSSAYYLLIIFSSKPQNYQDTSNINIILYYTVLLLHINAIIL